MNFYDITMNDISGKEIDFSQFKGKKVLVVNTASACGLTPQFEQLEEIYQHYKETNFQVIGFPSNDFMGQDPGTNEEIATFCQRNYGVSFLMMEKITVLGENAHPLYKWLTSTLNTEVKWNFHKFLIDENGEIVKDIDPKTLPTDKAITDWIAA
jgi:glutathione peroxidase